MTTAMALAIKAAIIGAYMPGSAQWLAAAIAAEFAKAKASRTH
jgi:hypothetical protein